ncbi:MAG: hypothetical protein QOJ29_1682 [Thermoleophilaceae bacterium]|jgi:hypothetical protein|nr:hypothetical protein [Thermoleophilaceae bacterium]
MFFKRTLTLALLTALLAPVAADAKAPTTPLRIEVLSNRADLISAGDALVAIGYSKGIDPASIRVTLGKTDVTSAFATRENGRFEGLLTGLAVGKNTLQAKLRDGRGARITISNHPNGGPVFSGPQVKPWKCQPTAKDEQCNEPVKYEFQYMSTDGSMKTYDPKSPPSDVAETTTDQGKTVPFIVRTETGYQDRDQYQIAILYDPAKPWTAWAPQPQWNHKLLITHGASCGIDHQTGSAPSTTGDTVGVPGGPGLGNSPTTALGRGFAVLSTALDNAGHNCNLVTQAESLVMAKERLVEQYGELRYTIGTGCSGGSLTQQQVANAYPGIYQGILPQCSFPDGWSTGQQLAAYNLLRRYLENPGAWAPGVEWDPASIGAVEGHPNHVNSIVFDTVYWTDLGVPDDGCAGVPAEQNYNAQTNPGGVRCTLADYMINVFGPRPEDLWTAVEKKLGHGFAGIPLGDVGVQFGLEALKKGQITPAQFVDLNQKVGGVDIDVNPTPDRLEPNQPALRRAYLSGAINSTNNMKGVAIIDLRGPDPGAFHDAYRSWAIRARLEREEGHFPKNHVIWFGHAPLIGDPNWTTEGLLAMDRWLTKVEADKRGVSLEQKVADDKPSDITDRCSQVAGVEQVVVPGVGRVCELDQVQTKFSTPAMVAGESIATDTNMCRLKPLRQSDYYPLKFTDEQWQALAKAFPTGVCDWSKPGIDQQGAIPWQTYQDASGAVIYGGRPLGPAPRSSAIVPKKKARAA